MSQRTWIRRGIALSTITLALLFVPRVWPSPTRSAPARLRLVEIGSDSTAFDVVATLVVGPTEALLWDAQYHAPDAKRVADAIQASGAHLKAIVLSHPDEDHISGVAAILERFPGTPVYMSAAGLQWFAKGAEKRFKTDKARLGALMPDSLVTPKALPSNRFTVDGQVVEVIPDLQGDVLTPTNSVLWIPSLRTVLAGDVVFNGVHPWLGSSDSASRVAWRASLQRIGSLKPTAVVAGHKKDISASDAPAVLQHMRNYLDDFDALVKSAQTAPEVRDKMLAKYPDLAVRMLVGAGAFSAMQKKPGAVAAAAQSAAPAGNSAPLQAGKWTGTITGPGGDVSDATYDVTNGGGANHITITVIGRGGADATEIRFDGTNLSFTFQPGPVLACELTKRADAALAGTCTAGGASGTMVMIPPK